MKSTHKHIKINKGATPVLISAPHVVPILRQDNQGAYYLKPKEKYVRKILREIRQKTDAWSIRTKGPGILVGWDEDVHDIYRSHVKEIIEKKGVNLFLDIHGSKKDRPFLLDYDFKIPDLHEDDRLIEESLKANIEKHTNTKKDDLSNGFFREVNGPGEETLTYFVRHNFGIPAVQIELNETMRTEENKAQGTADAICETIQHYFSKKGALHH